MTDNIDTMTATECLNADIADALAPKTYSSKSNAVRAFRAAYPDAAAPLTTVQIVEQGFVDQDEPGKWVVNDPAVLEDSEQARADREHEERQRAKAEEKKRQEQAERDAETNHPMLKGKTPEQVAFTRVDEPKAARPVRAASGSSNGLKIEQNRDTANGVTRPSAGGKCRAVWDMLDSEGRDVTAKRAREVAEQRGFDKTTTMVQFYKWRKFNGISGRQ